jgi:CBS domain-containing protein
MRTDHDPTMEHLRTVGQRGAWAVVRHRGRLVGVVTLADILARPAGATAPRAVPAPSAAAGQPVGVAAHASRPLMVAANQPLTEAARLLDRHHLDTSAVVDGHGQPVGVLTTGDLIPALVG